jgi:hypothetical protein
MEDAYRLARLVEEESGLVGYDVQADQLTMTGDARKAAAQLGGVAQWAQENLTRDIGPNECSSAETPS